ncbi:protein kinase [Paenibacillus sp. JX-17]|uniref:Protein kinase n=1 Tax=Paenibacillus lacisoli TaxID=3064525 RepID=A0ABT9CBW5_9BACL|nr:protein kinase [Paenibacillus sp. JX-17]MDO7906753.1 protein kinase [Paenibacillus sp. JX-17]
MLKSYWRGAYEAWLDYPLRKGILLAERYEIIDYIGVGSYGLTYRCLDRLSGLKVAVKMAKRSKGPRAERMLQREAGILGCMDHPCIPKLMELTEYRGRACMVSAYLTGSTLEDLIFGEGRRFTERECLQWTLQLMDVVCHVHEQGYVHMDVRIPNVIMREGETCLIDFGLARRLGGESEEERLMVDAMMPERDPERQAPEVRTDLYDIGHFMLFMLYSSYDPAPGQAPAGWQEELHLHPGTRVVLERTLQLAVPYHDSADCVRDLQSVLNRLKTDGPA